MNGGWPLAEDWVTVLLARVRWYISSGGRSKGLCGVVRGFGEFLGSGGGSCRVTLLGCLPFRWGTGSGGWLWPVV